MRRLNSSHPRVVSLGAGRMAGDGRIRLLPSEDGWSLVTDDGRVLVRGMGQDSRHQCLEYARASGILAVLS